MESRFAIIPNEIWSIFPPKALYLKNILIYCGYDTPEAVLKLREHGELDQVFTFMKSISDIVEEKEALFGIFQKEPQRLCLLPGLKVIKDIKVYNSLQYRPGVTSRVT